ncbi:hypothetical protein [Kibdelosporangium aridum]|uniref:Uncharacterized protein n=1 Tax=Kibdelosporangium aridum TaxID=2030 RepID=A0A1Y5Y9U6_KIBAR|nr:hypothetical protein [Kibdelosporangium aridum]SMD27316.1 hypothetical protein SAMN05661093_10919 [Kibdelosporangium aridum]
MAITADQPQPSLSPVEQRLIEHIERGDLLDLCGGQPVDDAAMRSWDETLTISAGVIRDILRGRHVTDPDPHGLRLRGARIDGWLDLENITSAMSLELEDCFLELGVNARDADLKGLVLAGCRLSHPTEPPLDGTRLTATVVSMNGTVIHAHAAEGAVRLLGAHLGGLYCDGAQLVNDSGRALDAENLRVDQDVFLRDGFQARASGDSVVLDLIDTRIGGALVLSPDSLEHRTHALRIGALSTSWSVSVEVSRMDCRSPGFQVRAGESALANSGQQCSRVEDVQ